MNLFLLIMRRIFLFGFIGSLLALVLKGNLIIGNPIVMVAAVFLYFLFVLFGWIRIKSLAKKFGIPAQNYFIVFFKSLGTDIISPIGGIVEACKKDSPISKGTRVGSLIATYVIILTNAIIVLAA